MHQPGQGPTLTEVDRLRDSDRAAALTHYARLQDEIASDDVARVTWICNQVAPTAPLELAPLFRRVAASGPPALRREALHALAITAWYGGEALEAERLWAEGLRDAVRPRDRLWIRNCLNLAMALHDRRCLFEALVLTGMGKRAAAAADLPYLTAYAALKRSHLLIYLGDLDRAEAESEEVGPLLTRVTEVGERRVVVHERLGVRAHLARERGEHAIALAALDEQLAGLADQGHVEDAVVAGVHMEQLGLRFEAEPAARDRTLATLAALPERFDLGRDWRATWRQQLLDLSLRHAVARGDADAARGFARDLLASLGGEELGSRTMLRAARLGRLLNEELDAPEEARAAFEVASNACLQRVIEADAASRELPELAEATGEDRAIVRAYRKRMELRQREVLDAVAAALTPGHPAFDRLARNDMLLVCAWCYRVRSGDGVWIPLAHYLPTGSVPWVSHGICRACQERYFPRGAPAG